MSGDPGITPEEWAEYEARVSVERNLADPLWRISNLYSVLHKKTKRDVLFAPTQEQKAVLICIFMRGWLRIIIPKARQLGMSTLLAIIAVDGISWNSGHHVALIDKTAEDALKKHREKVVYVWERMPASIRNRLEENKSTTDKLIIRDPRNPNEAESTFTAAINFRGGTLAMLWISEWGAIQDDDRARSREIKAGALPAIELADKGLCVIETTWKGGLDGELGPLVKEALETPPELMGPKSWRLIFFPWWTEAIYAQEHGTIDPVSAAYFRELESDGVTLSHPQKLWYAEKRRTASSAKTIKEEYPSLMRECWENLPQGSVYGKWIEEARGTGRVLNYLAARDYPVHTFWDIGAPMNTVCWLAQVTPHEIRIVDVLMEMDMEMQERASWLRMLGWDYGCHYFPWDADNTTGSVGAPIKEFRRILGPQCRVVPRCHLEWEGISQTRQNFGRLKFLCDSAAKSDDLTTPGARVKRGLEFLARFRSERETSTGTAKDVTCHDRYSHCAAALRQLGQALAAGLIEGGNHVGGRGGEQSKPRLRTVMAGANW